MIDKTIPNRLQADADQRLVRPEAGEMLDAQNVTIAEGGSSSSGIIKNVRGTIAGTPLNGADRVADGDEVTVIGSVSDPQRGYVYWFVSDNSGDSEDAIYQYNASNEDSASFTTGKYRVVVKGAFLDFNSGGFVKADIVNAAFQQDGQTESILYFTDNINPPRKINVDRAISGGYDGEVGLQKKRSIEVIKGAETRSPDFSFASDLTVKSNGFLDSVFQFATQYKYIDGEESAISPYSALAVGRGLSLGHIEHTESTSTPSLSALSDNVCEISLNINPYKHDVEKVRLLARKGNLGAFYVVDQFDPKVNFVRSVFGNTNTLYDSATGVYKFYNDRTGPSVSDFTTNKLYDNVPLLAVGQSLSGGRLMYSSYLEGRPNSEITSGDIQLSVNYSSENTEGSSLIPSGDAASVIKQGGQNTQEVDIDLLGGDAFGSSATSQTPVAGGTKIRLSFTIQPTATSVAKSGTGGSLVSFPVTQIDNTSSPQVIHTGTASRSTLDLSPEEVDTNTNGSNPPISVNISYTTPSDTNVQGVRDALKNVIEQLPEAPVRYDMSSETTFSLAPDAGSTLVATTSSTSEFKVFYKLDDITAATNTDAAKAQLVIKTRISRVSFDEVNFVANDRTVTGGDLGDVLVSGMDEASDFSITGGASEVANQSASAVTMESVSGFKSGSTHNFGIVYYDEFNRSGFVNKIGSIYVPTPAERSTSPKGAASVRVTFSDNFTPPSWASRYQIVYSGRASVGEFTQYTAGGAFGARKRNGANGKDGEFTTALDTNSKRLYVSLKTLDIYNKEKPSSRSYSFTKGDKLRVISHRAETDDSTVYPLSQNDGGGADNPIEFDVVGVEVLGNDSKTNPIVGYDGSSGGAGDVAVEKTGTFLILEAPEIAAGIGKYNGFDWFDITGQPRTSGAAASSSNKWPQQTVVEIFTPKTIDENVAYYEIGHGALAGVRKDNDNVNAHGSFIDLYNGDVFNKPISCKSPVYDATGSTWNPLSSEDWEYRTLPVETSNPSEKRPLTDWNKGRPHAVFEDAEEVRRYNGITYSDAYAEDVSSLSLSSFNPSLANFFSLDSANGACNYIGNFRDDYLLAIQENRVARVPIGKDIITSPNTSGIISLSTQVLNTPAYYSGDFGCGDNPESVLIRDGNAFFVDTSRKKLVRLTSEGMSPISENGVDSLFKTNIDLFEAQGGTRIVSGYDPEDNQYYVTLRESGSFDGLTLGYNVSAGVWQSRYTFFPDMYADQNGTMYSAYYNDPASANNAELFFSHDNESDYNTFYGTFGNSVVKIASNSNPSMTKVFNAVSLEGNSPNWVADPIVTDLNSNAQSLGFIEKEGSYYSFITRDENGTKHITGVGRVASVNSFVSQITFVNKVNRNSIPYGSVIRLVSGGAYTNLGGGDIDVTFVRFVDAYTIEVDGAPTQSGIVDGDLVAISEAAINGDPVRGHWAEITLTNNNADAFELYCVNTHVAQSDQDHSLGQQ